MIGRMREFTNAGTLFCFLRKVLF